MKNKIAVYYYLRINENEIIDFSTISEFEGIEDYLTLNIFTGYHDNKEELIQTLKKLELIAPSKIVRSIDIVKRKGNKKDGYTYKYLTNTLVFKDELKYLSLETIKDFVVKNQKNHEIMKTLVDEYKDNLQKKVHSKERNIEQINKTLSYMLSNSDKKELEEEVQKERNSLMKFKSELLTLQRIEVISNRMENGSVSNDMINEYAERLSHFIDNEVYYYRDGKVTPNNRGLVKLAKVVSRLVKKFDNIYVPNPTKKHNDTLNRFDKLLNQTLINNNPKIDTFSLDEDDFEEEIDPDTYMFLDASDYDYIRSDISDIEAEESIEASIENLEIKQGRHR